VVMKSEWLSIFKIFNRKKTSLDLKQLESILTYRFRNKSILIAALAHKSYLRTKVPKEVQSSNERLEFLGDSVLGLVVSAFLYQKYPHKPEGELTKMKAILVNEVTLSRRAKEFKLGEFLLLSPEEERSGGRQRESILADTCEAIIAAAYLDGGMKAAQKIVQRLILERHQEATADRAQHNYKGELLEFLQGRGLGMPRYEVEVAEGPDHKKVFTIGAYAQGRKLGTGRGGSKKEAEQVAARIALEKLKAEERNVRLTAQKTEADS
jgi:ribonuclease III